MLNQTSLKLTTLFTKKLSNHINKQETKKKTYIYTKRMKMQSWSDRRYTITLSNEMFVFKIYKVLLLLQTKSEDR